MTVKEKYERAVQRLASHDNKYKAGIGGTAGFAAESVRRGLVHEVLSLRGKLVESGEWDGPIIVRSKAKYRG